MPIEEGLDEVSGGPYPGLLFHAVFHVCTCGRRIPANLAVLIAGARLPRQSITLTPERDGGDHLPIEHVPVLFGYRELPDGLTIVSLTDIHDPRINPGSPE